MSNRRINQVYVKETGEDIYLEDYRAELHYGKIYCSECKVAKIHIVEKRKTTYFASNRNEEHLEDCSFYHDLISNSRLLKLINSVDIQDKEELFFLIKKGMTGAWRLLLKEKHLQNTDVQLLEKNIGEKKITKTENTRKYEMKSIPRIHISNIFREENKKDYDNQYIIIYGEAKIDVKEYERENKTTKEKFKVKHLYFREKDTLRFSMDLTGKNAETNFDFDNNTFMFVAFGLLQINKYNEREYINLKIKDLHHFTYIKQ